MKYIALIIVLLVCGVLLATTYDKSVPLDTGEQPSQGAERIRNLAAANQEINNIDHYWPLNGSVVDDADKGQHRQVTFQSQITTPTVSADQGILYIKDFDGGAGAKAELVWRCEDDLTELQLTELNTAGTSSVINLTGTYENEVNFSNTGNSFNTDALSCTAAGLLTLPTDTTDTTEANLRYNTTDDTVEYRNASAWAKLVASTGMCKMKLGQYTGDGGTTQAVTGVGFQPGVIFVLPGDSTQAAHLKTEDMGTTYSKCTGVAANSWVDDAVRSLDADGFTVGDGTGGSGYDNMNKSGVVFYYIAAVVLD